MLDLKLFLSTFALIFLAEFPDKTALTIVLLASRHRPWAVFLGVSLAFAVQSMVAVSFGSLLGLLPESVVHAGAALMFFVFAALIWFRKEEKPENVDVRAGKGSFLKVLRSSFVIIF